MDRPRAAPARFRAADRPLPGRCWEEWLAAVSQALAELRRDHSPVLLVGYSLGGALCLAAVAGQPPDGLVLLAPFVLRDACWHRAVEALAAPFLPTYFRPFRWFNLSDLRVQSGVGGLFPHVDMAGAATQKAVRQLVVPVTLFEQVRQTGLIGYERAAAVPCPVLIVQGKRDQVASPKRTAGLLQRLPHEPRYVAVNADHNLLGPSGSGWPEVERAVREFADTFTSTTATP